MGRIISVTNQKGGVGKTTTAVNLSACLAEAGKKILIVDLDPQGNTSTGLGIDKAKLKNTIYNVLLSEVKLDKILIKTKQKNLIIAPANMNLAGSEIEFIGIENREYLLKNTLNEVRDNYDFIIIDCPPSLSMLTINAMTASDTVLVPIQCEYYALEGLTQLIHTINLVKKRLNPDLFIEGMVFTMFDARTNLSIQVVEEVKHHLKENVYKTIIPRNVRLGEAPSHGLPINLYDSISKGAESYRFLAEEVINNEI
ncbi:MAG: chromosome partitioning protein ParA [Clostridiales bacterium GWE2_32_10]|nr:MAG: chromosome partitioning protein ParA [Clostridiales bacterium GWE2_32_10]HBY20593.1 chromosome partitioning protein ParA [Clostridiales bacterium]